MIKDADILQDLLKASENYNDKLKKYIEKI